MTFPRPISQGTALGDLLHALVQPGSPPNQGDVLTWNRTTGTFEWAAPSGPARYYAHDVTTGAETSWTLPLPPTGTRHVSLRVHAVAADPAVACAVVVNAGGTLCTLPAAEAGGGDAWGEMTWLDWPTSVESVGHAWDVATGTITHTSTGLVAPIDEAHPLVLTSVDTDTFSTPVPLPVGSRIEAWAA